MDVISETTDPILIKFVIGGLEDKLNFSSYQCNIPNIKMMKSRRMICEGHVARMGDENCAQNFGSKASRGDTTWKV
jgi:hypothetical protein